MQVALFWHMNLCVGRYLVEITGTNTNWRWWATHSEVPGCERRLLEELGVPLSAERWALLFGARWVKAVTLTTGQRWLALPNSWSVRQMRETRRDFQWSLYLQHRNCVLPWPSSCLHLYSVGPSPPFIPWCWTSLVAWQRCNTSF